VYDTPIDEGAFKVPVSPYTIEIDTTII